MTAQTVTNPPPRGGLHKRASLSGPGVLGLEAAATWRSRRVRVRRRSWCGTAPGPGTGTPALAAPCRRRPGCRTRPGTGIPLMGYDFFEVGPWPHPDAAGPGAPPGSGAIQVLTGRPLQPPANGRLSSLAGRSLADSGSAPSRSRRHGTTRLMITVTVGSESGQIPPARAASESDSQAPSHWQASSASSEFPPTRSTSLSRVY